MRYLILAIAFLGGCSAIVPTGVARLSALSPLEADPADIAVSLDLPDGVSIADGSAQILLMAARLDTDEKTLETYVLAKSIATSGAVIYAVATKDHGRFRDQQSLIRNWKAIDEDMTSGSFGVTLEGCTLGDGPSDGATLSINVRTSVDGQFFPLVRNAKVADVLEQGEFDALQPCP